MADILHITSGDSAGESLTKAGLFGEVFVWHDILYEGPRNPGWPSEVRLGTRALFLGRYDPVGQDKRTGGPCTSARADRRPHRQIASMEK